MKARLKDVDFTLSDQESGTVRLISNSSGSRSGGEVREKEQPRGQEEVVEVGWGEASGCLRVWVGRRRLKGEGSLRAGSW